MAKLKRYNAGTSSWEELLITPDAHSHDASDIDSGTLSSARIPSLPYLSDSGGTLDGGTNTTLTLKSNDTGASVISLIGDSQGTGRVYVGQSSSYGGGLEYNGDGNPDYSGAGSDQTTLFRRSNNTVTWTAKNHVNSNDWYFRGAVYANTSDKLATEAYVDSAVISDTNNYATGVSGSGDGTLTITRAGLADITANLAHSHSEYASSGHTHSEYLTSNAVDSVNGQTGTVSLDYNDVGALADHEKAADSHELDGMSQTDQDTGDTIMRRNSSGDTWARLFRSSYSSTNGTIAGIYTTRTIGGDYMRPSTPAQVKSSLGLSANDIVGLGPLSTKATDGNQSQFLRGDGVWAVPPDNDTNHYVTTASFDGTTLSLARYGMVNATVDLSHSHSEYSSTSHTHTASEVGALGANDTAVNSTKWDGYEVQINGTDGNNIINFKI